MIRRMILCGALVLSACKPGANANAPAAATPLRTDQDKTLYALGLFMGRRMGDFNLTPAELAIVQRGIHDQVTGARPEVPLDQWGPRINELAQQRQASRGTAEKARGRAFAERAAHEAGAVLLPSGLVYRETQAGTGPQPSAEDTVRVHYRGTLIDGTEFDSSHRHGDEPVEFPLRGVIPCWTEGVGRMHVGGKARLVCPSDIAYGDRGQREIPPGATLVFEIELLGVTPAAAAAPSMMPSVISPSAPPAAAPSAAAH